MASTYGYASPVVPGEPPRTSVEQSAPSGKWKTVHPVGPSSYSATPISRPGKSKSSVGPSKATTGTSSARSWERRGTGGPYNRRRGEPPGSREVIRHRRAGRRVRRGGRGASLAPPSGARPGRRPGRLRGGSVLRGSG